MKLTVQDLAMFLGCEAQCFWTEDDGSLTFERIATITGVESYYDPKQENPIKVRAKIREGSKFTSGLAYELNEVKPILRPLSDMTYEEAKECAIILWYLSEEDFNNGIEEFNQQQVIRAKIDIRDGFGSISLPTYNTGFKLFKYLTQKHFDIFGWIEKGLAISKV